MKLKSFAAAILTAFVLAVGSATSASAALINDFGVQDIASTGTASFGWFQPHALAEPQPFTDDFTFSVNQNGQVTFEFQVNNSQGRLIDVATGSPDIFSAELLAGGAPIGPGQFATQDSPNGTTFTLAFADLMVGTEYTLQVIGTVLAQAGGTYTFSANLSEVPLPAAAWLLLSALAGLLGMTRLGRRQAQAA
jgi:hypothetical protein